MNNNDNFNYKINPVALAVGATFLTLFIAILTDFGNRDYGTHGRTGNLSGTFIIIMFLVLPIFFKGYREYIWTKKGLIILFAALVVNLPIDIICLMNRYS